MKQLLEIDHIWGAHCDTEKQTCSVFTWLIVCSAVPRMHFLQHMNMRVQGPLHNTTGLRTATLADWTTGANWTTGSTGLRSASTGNGWSSWQSCKCCKATVVRNFSMFWKKHANVKKLMWLHIWQTVRSFFLYTRPIAAYIKWFVIGHFQGLSLFWPFTETNASEILQTLIYCMFCNTMQALSTVHWVLQRLTFCWMLNWLPGLITN